MSNVQNKINLKEILKRKAKFLSFLKTNDLVEGKIIKKEGQRRIIVDLGRYGLGAIYNNELVNAKDALKNFKIGDVITVKVINPDNEDNLVELSLMEASKQKVWDEILELKEKEEILTLKPKKFNRGGLILEINGLPAFLPISQLKTDRLNNNIEEDKNKIVALLEKLLDEELKIKIINIDLRNRKIIVSEREAYKKDIGEYIKNYQVNQIIEAIVTGITDFGIFIKFSDNPNIEELIHISELSHKAFFNPKDNYKIDDIIKAKIIDIKNNKIILSVKALQENPWEKANNYYQKGQIVKGEVYILNPFGAIINLNHDLQGVVHITDFEGDIEKMKKTLEIGKKYDFLIEEIKPEEKRIILKLKK